MELTSITALTTTVSWCYQLLVFSIDTMLNSPLPTMTTPLKCRLLFLSFAEFPSTQECRSWLGIGRKATGLKQLTQAHEGPVISDLSELVAFFLKDYLLLGGKERVLVMTASRAKWNSRHSRDRYFWVDGGHLILCPCLWAVPCCLLLF